MSDKKHQGWANYETWAVSLWLNNEESSYKYWHREARTAPDVESLVDQMKEEISDEAPELEGLWADLLGAALSEVNWYEIAEEFYEEHHKAETKGEAEAKGEE